MRRLWFALAAAISFVPMASANAGLLVCNKSGQAASVAYASVVHNAAFPTQAVIYGWYSVADGQCVQLNNSAASVDWYVYARGTNRTIWGGQGENSSINLCEPQGNGGPVFDNLQNACNRLPYYSVDRLTGVTTLVP